MGAGEADMGRGMGEVEVLVGVRERTWRREEFEELRERAMDEAG
jgi:hypothetical protein